MTVDDTILLIGIFCFCLGAVIAFAAFHIYRGVHDSLGSAHIGGVYNFRYLQPLTGEYERYLAKVVNIRKLTKFQISRLNRRDYRVGDKKFQRTPTLVTCEMNDGSYRQFYAERSDMCMRTALGGFLFKMGVAHLF